MKNKYFEISVGFFVIVGVLCLAFLTFKVSGSSLKAFGTKHYTIEAQFKNVGSLSANAGVKIAGVDVGRVTKIALKKNYNGFIAVVTMSIDKGQNIPANYSATITMSGILGDNYVALSPPKEDIVAIAGLSSSSDDKGQYLHQGSVISLENTQSAIDLGSLINTFVAGSDSDKSKK